MDEGKTHVEMDEKLGNQKKQSENILNVTGIWDYISPIPDEMRDCRTMYGFLGKPNRSSLKIEKKRWVFLISSRPLSQDAYLEDHSEISEDHLPHLMSFDTVYYYSTGYNNDEVTLAGEISTLDIDNITTSSNGDMHSFTIDAKSKKYQFVSKRRFIIEQWVDAIELSTKTAKEKQSSITGKIKNISMIITKYEMDRDQLLEELEKDIDFKLWNDDMSNYKEYEEVHLTLEVLSEIKDDMVYTFDACMVQKPPRKDIIEMYMDSVNVKICERLTYEWDSKVMLMNPLDILCLLEWVYEYYTLLKKFGVTDDALNNGYLTLVNAYKRKIHMQIYPMITNVLIRERDAKIEESDSGYLYTHSPNDIFKIFNEVFDILSKKPMKELVLGVLEIEHEVFSQYQRALHQMISMDTSLKLDYLIALNNNFSKFFDRIEILLEPLKYNENITEQEVEEAFDQRTVQQYFAKITTKVMERITEQTWNEVGHYFLRTNYLELDLENVLNKCMKVFDEKVQLMNKQTAREVWK